MAGLLYLTSLWYTVQASKRKHDKLQDVMSHTDVIGMQLKKKKKFFFGHPHWQHKSFHLCSELMSQLTLLFTNFQLVFKCPREVQCLRQYKHHCLMQVDV